MITIKITTDRESALYHIGEKAGFAIGVHEGEKPLQSGLVTVQFSSDTEAVFQERKYDLSKNNPLNLEWAMPVPGFLRCRAWMNEGDKKIKGQSAAAFEPENILPVLPEPEDFDGFWQDSIKSLDAIPEDARLERLDDSSGDKFDCYKVSFANIANTRIYGFLSVPKGAGPFPALICVPGAGRSVNIPDTQWVKEGVMVLLMNVHAYDPPKDNAALEKIHKELIAKNHYYCHGLEDKKKYFFRRAILGIYRATEWLTKRNDVDPARVVFSGVSQGGSMAFYQAGLSGKITAALIIVPGMGDHGGFLIGRHPATVHFPGFSEHLGTLAYFDTVNFAKRIKCPVMMGVGFLDDCCFPSSCYPPYNVMTCEKTVINAVEYGHALNTDKYFTQFYSWLRRKLGIVQKTA